MQTKSITKQNIAPEITCNPYWRIKQVRPLENYKLEVEFIDGLCGFVEMKNRIMSDKAGVFKALRDINVFNQVYVMYGTVTWPGEIDIAPDAMHKEIVEHGKWILN